VIGNSSRLKTAVLVLLCGLLAFAAAKYLTPALLHMTSRPDRSTGFDFDYIVKNSTAETGPAIGERIDLENLKGPDGNSLANMIGGPAAVIVAVSPDCGMCSKSADEMSEIRQRLGSAGVRYYLVSFEPIPISADFFKYADSLNPGAPAFLRSINEGNQPAPRLVTMLVPTHFLVDRSGVVMAKWPGSSNTESTRQQMANQIVSDTLKKLSASSPRASN
jgi:hypothetical protein